MYNTNGRDPDGGGGGGVDRRRSWHVDLPRRMSSIDVDFFPAYRRGKWKAVCEKQSNNSISVSRVWLVQPHVWIFPVYRRVTSNAECRIPWNNSFSFFRGNGCYNPVLEVLVAATSALIGGDDRIPISRGGCRHLMCRFFLLTERVNRAPDAKIRQIIRFHSRKDGLYNLVVGVLVAAAALVSGGTACRYLVGDVRDRCVNFFSGCMR